MIKAKNIAKSYGALAVLKGVTVDVAPGQIVSLVGASGAGKTTFLQIAGTLDKADSGSLEINGIEVSALNGKQLARFRNEHIGFVFQFHHLLPEFTALENVCIPAYIANLSKADAEERAKELLEFLGLADRLTHKPNELSGGEKQRVAVARALINKPAVVFADEPSGNLDSTNTKELHELFFSLRDKFQQTFLIVTHNEELASMSDRKLTIKDGIIAD
ncbi:MAG: ABC transporter ATP-binding protein [Flavobacteriales bacterium]|nr:ABC transporter ATP-binding protein [Flavobacteriales bacterium]